MQGQRSRGHDCACKTLTMKPSFALDFRDGAIALLHRTSRGWQQVGVTSFDAADLTEALSYLRSTALGLSPRGLSTKLVIPNEQILYTQVHAPGPDAAKRRKQIRAGLVGLTPYKVDDLVYDWWGSGPEVHVAVVARETLAEAEAFAVDHRFNPVSFVAAPDSGDYRGEPFFGPSALSATLLAEGEKVERDQDPIAVVAREYPRAEAAPVAAAPVAVAPIAEVPAPVEVPDLAAAEPAAVSPGPAPSEPMVAEPAVVEPAVAEPVVAEPIALPVETAAEPAVEDPNPLPDFSTARAPAAGVNSFDPKAMAIDLVDEAPMALDVTDDPQAPPDVAAGGQASGGSAAQDDLPASPAPSMMAAFASRRSAEPVVVAKDATTADFAAILEAKAKKAPPVGPAPPQRPSVPRPTLARPAAALPSAARDALPFPNRAQAAKLAPPRAKVGVTSPGIAGLKRDRNVVPLAKPAAAQDAETAAKSAAKGLTGLDGRPLPIRGKPRYLGLALTGLLLLALALAAAWSSYYLSSNEVDPNAAPPTNAVASVTPDPAVDAAAEAMPSVEDEALADGQDPEFAAESATPPAIGSLPVTSPSDLPPETVAVEAAITPVAAPAAIPVPEPATDPVPELAAEPLPEPAPATSVVTDAAVAAAPGNDPQDEIFLAAADTPPRTSDPLVMPQMAVGNDPPPALAAPPPPFGTVYTFDANGRIQPTPEGIMTPEGVLLIAGAPKLVPPLRPAALTVAAPAPTGTQPAAAAPDVAAPEVAEPEGGVGAVVSDPALAGKKPKPRPAGLTTPDATANQQGEALPRTSDSRFANVRPQGRPAALTQTATGPATADLATADLASSDLASSELANAAAGASLALGGVQASTSVLAMAVSRKPAARPSGMDQAVDAAVAAAVQAADPEPQLQTASLAPEEQSEPEAEAPAPSLPTSASVAKQATTKDALNLSRVALLGIFGTASGRYAMVRQPGGAVKKIVVGDTIDGGRVAAISASAVQYKKGGRMVTLSLPQG